MQRTAYLLLAMIFLNTAAIQAEPAAIAQGKTVKFDYTLTVDGQVVDTSVGKQPLEYIQGQQMLIPGLERQMEGMKAGDAKIIEVASAEGYGAPDPQAIVEVPKSKLTASDIEPQKGMMLQMRADDGRVMPGMIEEIKRDSLVVNFNHPLAGKDLTFDIKVIDVQ